MINLYSHWNHIQRVWCRRNHLGSEPILNAWTTQRVIDDLTSWNGSVNLYNVCDVDHVGSQSGYYVLFAGNVHEVQQHPDLLALAPHMRELVAQGHLRLLIFFVHETFNHWSTKTWGQRLLDDLTLLDIAQPGSVTVVLGTKVWDLPQDPRITWIYYPWFAGMTQQIAQQTLLRGAPVIEPTHTRPKKFLSLGGRTKPHRLYLLKYLEYLDIACQGMATFDYSDMWQPRDPARTFAPGWQESYRQIKDLSWPDCDTAEDWQALPPWVRQECQQLHGFDPEARDRSHVYPQDDWPNLLRRAPDFLQWLDQHGHQPQQGYIDVNDPFTHIRKGWFGAARYYRHIGWDVVQETMHYVNDGVFLTEKTWRPMVMGVPFVINGCQGSLALLRDLGYQTFDGIIDETYDTLADPMARIEALAQEIQRICHAPESWWPAIEPRVRHNQQHVWQHLYGRDIHDLIKSTES